MIVYNIQRKQSLLNYRGTLIDNLERELRSSENKAARGKLDYQEKRYGWDISVIRYYVIVGGTFAILLLFSLILVALYSIIPAGQFSIMGEIVGIAIVGSLLAIVFVVIIYLDIYNHMPEVIKGKLRILQKVYSF